MTTEEYHFQITTQQLELKPPHMVVIEGKPVHYCDSLDEAIEWIKVNNVKTWDVVEFVPSHAMIVSNKDFDGSPTISIGMEE